MRNRVARQMNGNNSMMQKPLVEAVPWLTALYDHVMKTEKADIRLIIVPGTKMTVSVKCSPVIANNELSGAVFNLTDVTQIQELEGQIRRKLSDRGLKARYTFDDILHQSKIIDRAIEVAKRYAESDSNIIIVGESGTGKELFAQSIHNASSRKTVRLWQLTAQHCLKTCWRVNSLVMWRVLLPEPARAEKWDFLSRPTVVPCFWMRWGKFLCQFKPSFCVYCRRGR